MHRKTKNTRQYSITATPYPRRSRCPTNAEPGDSLTSLPPPPRRAPVNNVLLISGLLRPPAAAQASLLPGPRSMESVGAGGDAEAGGSERVGAFAPPGCYRAWPPPLRPTDVAGPPCAGSVCAAGWRPAAPASARVSVRPRLLPPRKPDWRTGPSRWLCASPGAVRTLALPQFQPLLLSGLRLCTVARPAWGAHDRPS